VKQKAGTIKANGSGTSKGRKSTPAPSKGQKVSPTPEKDRSFTMVFPANTGSADMVVTKGRDEESRGRPKIARSLDDLPMVEIEGVNGQMMRIAITQGKDGRIQASWFLTRK
jgi:hypothetical protein